MEWSEWWVKGMMAAVKVLNEDCDMKLWMRLAESGLNEEWMQAKRNEKGNAAWMPKWLNEAESKAQRVISFHFMKWIEWNTRSEGSERADEIKSHSIHWSAAMKGLIDLTAIERTHWINSLNTAFIEFKWIAVWVEWNSINIITVSL